MEITGAVVLVTGANRGLGRALSDQLLAAGAAKVYAGARDVSTVAPREGLVPVRVDVTDVESLRTAAARLTDVTIVVNNAGTASLGATPLTAESEALRTDFEVNTFGLLEVTRAFAPVIEANGGGSIVNVLSALSWFTLPEMALYAASKAASWSLTNALRAELAPRGVHVAGLHVGWMDTDMAAHIDSPKTSPEVVANEIVSAIRTDEWEVIVDDFSRMVKDGLSSHPSTVYRDVVLARR
ncbi:SDR family oxidoreductase [Microbacterium sp. I2]|uniref:SDR family oxidoreductase n=1 Tax=Microbacterium sp. I2 TaxID=3391826 RepID=UPI003ED92063